MHYIFSQGFGSTNVIFTINDGRIVEINKCFLFLYDEFYRNIIEENVDKDLVFVFDGYTFDELEILRERIIFKHIKCKDQDSDTKLMSIAEEIFDDAKSDRAEPDKTLKMNLPANELWSKVLKKGYTCDICGHTSDSINKIVSHTKTHINAHSLKCHFCSFTFMNTKSLANHISLLHKNQDCEEDLSSNYVSSEDEEEERASQSEDPNLNPEEINNVEDEEMNVAEDEDEEGLETSQNEDSKKRGKSQEYDDEDQSISDKVGKRSRRREIDESKSCPTDLVNTVSLTPRKIPKWSTEPKLSKALRVQEEMCPDKIFPEQESITPEDINRMFPETAEERDLWNSPRRRSSANQVVIQAVTVTAEERDLWNSPRRRSSINQAVTQAVTEAAEERDLWNSPRR